MLKPRWLLSAVMIGVASVQALDSHVLSAGGYIQLLVAVGALLPAVAVLLTTDARVCGATVAAGAALMLIARMTSTVRLPELMLAAVFPAIVVLLDHVKRQRSAHAASDRA